MNTIPDAVLDSFRNNGYHVFEIPPYRGSSYAIVSKDELDDPDDFDLNKMNAYDGFVIEEL